MGLPTGILLIDRGGEGSIFEGQIATSRLNGITTIHNYEERLSEEVQRSFGVALVSIPNRKQEYIQLQQFLNRHALFRNLPVIFLLDEPPEDQCMLFKLGIEKFDVYIGSIHPKVLENKIELFIQWRQTLSITESKSSTSQNQGWERNLTPILEAQEPTIGTRTLADRIKDDFLANMSHELRTPLHGIISYAQFGKKKYKSAPPEKIEKYFNQICHCGERLLLLLNDLLDLSKLESGRTVYNFKEQNITNVIDFVIEEYTGLARDKEISLVRELINFDDRVNMDRVKMGQVFQNLLSNAIKFSPAGSQITIRLEQQPSLLVVSVADAGIGIPSDELLDIFDKFVQSSKTKTGAGGTGLGLPICKQIIDDHNGKIWAENNPHGGATISFCLPQLKRMKVPILMFGATP